MDGRWPSAACRGPVGDVCRLESIQANGKDIARAI